MQTKKRIAIIGAGNRGQRFANIIKNSSLGEVVAVAEPREDRRGAFCDEFNIAPDQAFDDWRSFVEGERRCDAVVISTMDQEHVGPAIACLEQGYDILLEKPMAVTLDDCRAIEAAQRRSGAIVQVCHSLRYHRAFRKVKELIDGGAIGRLISLDLLEQVKPWHHAHSYVRGNWGNTGRSSFMLLAKSCHDIDYLAYLTGKSCLHVSSFGSLTWFRSENAPAGAPKRCTDGCPVEFECPYSAFKAYPGDDTLDTSPLGRCVYHCDNDAVDHQVVCMEFEDAITATFTMTAFGRSGGRRLRAHGTLGDLSLHGNQDKIQIRMFPDRANKAEQENGDVINIDLAKESGGHGGGDARVTLAWLRSLHTRDESGIVANAQESLRSHAIVFAAEKARLEKRVVAVSEVEAEEMAAFAETH